VEDMPLYKKIALGVGAVALFGCIISGILLVQRGSDAKKIGQASKEPEDITLAKLIARGPDGNAHVRVSDLVFDTQYLSQTATTNGVESIKYVWAVARVPGEAPGGPVRVLVKNSRVSSQSEADAFLASRVIQGIVINKIDRPDEEDVRLLRGAYPSFDPDKVIMVQADREPPGQLAAFNGIFCLISGLIAVLCAAAAFWDYVPGLAPRRKKRRRRRPVDDDED
jgi:hypothetical protein